MVLYDVFSMSVTAGSLEGHGIAGGLVSIFPGANFEPPRAQSGKSGHETRAKMGGPACPADWDWLPELPELPTQWLHIIPSLKCHRPSSPSVSCLHHHFRSRHVPIFYPPSLRTSSSLLAVDLYESLFDLHDGSFIIWLTLASLYL